MGLTFQSTPGYYGAEQLAEEAFKNYKEPFKQYKETRVAPFSPLQQQAFRQAQEVGVNPAYRNTYNEAIGNVRNAAGENILPQLQPYIEASTQNPTINAQRYMNPYQDEVIANIGKYAARNLHENILPGVRDKFIGAGQYGSTGHQTLAGRAIRDTQEEVARRQAEALQGGYNKALETAVGQQGAQLQAGKFLGQAAHEQAGRQLYGGEKLASLGLAQQQGELANAGYLQNLGAQERQREQDIANARYKAWQEERAYPHEQLARVSELVKGLPSQTHMQYKSEGPVITPPGLSPYTRGAGALLSGAGMLGQGMAAGGHVKPFFSSMISTPPYPVDNPKNSMILSHQPYHQTKPYVAPKNQHTRHFAEGGEVPNPIQRGANDAMDTAEMRAYREQAHNMANPQGSPIWQAIARAGAAIAGSQAKTTGEALGQGFESGANEFQNVMGQREAGKLESAKMMKLIHDTRAVQEERDRKHQLELKQHEETARHHKASEGLQASELSRKISEGKILGNGQTGFFKLNEETGELEKLGIKGAPEGTEAETYSHEGQTYEASPLDTLEKNAKAEYQKDVLKDVKNISKNNQALKAIKTIQEVYERNPNIGTKWVNILDDTEGNKSLTNLFGRNLVGKDLVDAQILKKATSELNLDTILGVPAKAATDLLKRTIKESSLSGQLTKEAVDKISASLKEKAQENNKFAQARHRAMQKGFILVPTAYDENASNPVSAAQDDWSNLGSPAE